MTAPLRKIIHIDMDAFFAAVEQRDHPQYRNKPLIVGGMPDSRGVVATCSYEARQFGVHSAMPSSQAYRLCPQAIFVKPRFAAYQEASHIIRSIFARHCDCFEPLSLDEAYLDVSQVDLFQGSATLIARHIKQEIRRQTQLTASAGISYNKFLAKIASDLGKPDGLYLITPEQGEAFVEKLAIGRFHGIGRATEKKMLELGIKTGADLKHQPLPLLQKQFGKAAHYYFDLARGIDHRPVTSHRQRKSIGVETTFETDIEDPQLILTHLQQLLERAAAKLNEKHFDAHTLTIKIKFHNFVQITRGRSFAQAINQHAGNDRLLRDLLKDTGVGEKKVRLLGVSLSGLQSHNDAPRLQQLDLFENDWS